MKLLWIIFLSFISQMLFGQEYRFPRPEFTGNYQQPVLSLSNPESWLVSWMDLAFLVFALIFAFLALYKYRSRVALYVITVVSLLYLGFLRKGCVCPVGSIQPVVQTFFDSGMILPLSTLLVFLIPITCTLFFGRIFCGSVCPLGAVQEVISSINARIPASVNSVLKLIPPAYLILAGVAAATGSDYLICRFDPFVGLFRLNLTTEQVPVTLFFLLFSLIVYRPYCRFICPYGWILGLAARLSMFKVKAVYHNCINCGLCDGACPSNAVETPLSENFPFIENQKKLRKLLIIMPVLIIFGGIIGYSLSPVLSPIHRDIAMLEVLENPTEENSLEYEAFWGGGYK